MKRAYLVQGLAYGDEAKGSIVEALCRKVGASLVVRFCGGPNAAHNVVLENGVHHTFASFGSGTFAGAKTYISRFTLIEPRALMNEYAVLQPKVGVLPAPFIEDDCPVITPFHKAMNQVREICRGDARHGSCGIGVGEVMRDIEAGAEVLRAKDLNDLDGTISKLTAIRDRKEIEMRDLTTDLGRDPFEVNIIRLASYYRNFAKAVKIVPNGFLEEAAGKGPVIFEGAQGMMLDQKHGTFPHVTWSNCTFGNAMELLSGLRVDITKIGVLRAHWTRHGAGPFPTESEEVNFPDHNKCGAWQGKFRQGYFDAVAARHALDCIGGVDDIALTCVDRIEPSGFMKYASAYRPLRGPDYDIGHYENVIRHVLKCKLGVVSRGPTAADKVWG